MYGPPTARNKIEEILDYISKDNLDAEAQLINEFEKRVNNLKKYPKSGRIVPILDNEHIRELIIRHHYRIIYQINKDRIEILTIRHVRQDFNQSDLDI
ncbi:MAG TPA: type II toxin-antitoxin system RelE/ParE family toxin [Balneolales bacterium]|nr:type II toxin-antitoxin system RelE/ParE family toxin [Balneolales bacterium]